MNTITLTIAATPSNLMKLAQAFGDSIDTVLAGEDVPMIQYSRELEDAAGVKMKPGEIRPRDTQPKDPEAEQALADPEPEKPAVTKTDVRQKALELTKAGETAKVEEVFARFGAKKFTQLKESDYADVLEALEAVS